MWRGGLPTLRLIVSDVPKHGWLIESDETRLRPGAEILPSLLTTEAYMKYMHDDSETKEDQVILSLWLDTIPATMSNGSTWSSEGRGGGGGDGGTSTWLLNVTLPIHIIPVNDQPFTIATPKAPIAPVVQVKENVIRFHQDLFRKVSLVEMTFHSDSISWLLPPIPIYFRVECLLYFYRFALLLFLLHLYMCRNTGGRLHGTTY